MIFYFTGTGNSQWVAEVLGARLQLEVFSITELMKRRLFTYVCKKNEALLFVFPVHSWGPPALVTSFIRNLSLDGYNGQPVYAVCTCGDDCGYTDRMIGETFREKGWEMKGCWSVTMPNNYILLPGFDVDSEEKAKEKLSCAVTTVETILEAIEQQYNVESYTTGSFPWIKSRLIQPWFVKYSLGKNAFYATSSCISCGLCEKLCPTDTIVMGEDGIPRWKNTCVQCLACIHRCPKRAIESGKATLKKGRYRYPGVR